MKKKVVAAIMSVALVAAVGIGGTLAYLSSQSDVVNNTFTIGHGYDDQAITLDEKNIDNSPANQERDTENVYKNMVPGKHFVKDPTVHIKSGSIESYIFVRVTGLDQLDEQHVHVWNNASGTLQQGVNTTDFKMVMPYDNNGDGIYVYQGEKCNVPGAANVVKADTNTDLEPVFDEILIDKEVNSGDFASITLDGKAINVQAAAVQYAQDEMDSYEDAMGALPKEWFGR